MLKCKGTSDLNSRVTALENFSRYSRENVSISTLGHHLGVRKHTGTGCERMVCIRIRNHNRSRNSRFDAESGLYVLPMSFSDEQFGRIRTDAM
ncbi:hypothetical protein WG66_009341 [Moniliophthora roreri]|nr:hypothetical protein WG66_009341 [Moniliophthora roreri]